MTLFDFIELPYTDRLNAVLNGVPIASKKHKRGICQLYNLENFFVEILYDLDDFKILKLQPLLFNDLLESYLSQISIEDLYQ